MKLESIQKLLTSKVWMSIVKHEYFRGYSVIDSVQNPSSRDGGAFYAIILFYTDKVSSAYLKRLEKELTNSTAVLAQNKIYEGVWFRHSDLGYSLKGWMIC